MSETMVEDVIDFPQRIAFITSLGVEVPYHLQRVVDARALYIPDDVEFARAHNCSTAWTLWMSDLKNWGRWGSHIIVLELAMPAELHVPEGL